MLCDKNSNPALNEPQTSEMIIQKSHPLLALWKSPLSLPEFKILDLYLSRIDSRHPEKRLVHFNKGEIEQLLNLTYLKPAHLKERLRNLCIMVEIPNQDYPNGFDIISLFERAVCVPDEDGVWQIDLECTPSAMKYIFNIDNIGYIKYRLQAICNLKSRYTYILFLYLEQNRFRVSWEEDLGNLREILGCSSEFYDSYKQFNSRILRRCQAELKEKTGYVFSYTPVRAGRRVKKIRFQIESQSPDLLEQKTTPAISKRDQYIDFLRNACCDPDTGEPEFSHTQIGYVMRILRELPEASLKPWTSAGPDRLALYHYLEDRYARLNQRMKKGEGGNRLAAFLQIIREDLSIRG